MHRLTALFAFVLVVLGLQSCELFNKPEEQPAYIMFRDPQVLLDSTTGFTSNAGIRDIWLYHDGLLQGTYPVNPVTDTAWTVVPFLDLDANDFFLEGGIHETGQSVFHLPYPFWERINFEYSATAGDTLVITPVFEYIEEDRYTLEINEGFEGGAVDLIPFATTLTEPDSTFITVRQDSYQGNGAGYIDFGPNDRYFEAVNTEPFFLSRENDVYAEITYRNNMEFTVGLIYQNISGTQVQPILTLAASPEWNTVYVHLISQVRNIINLGGPTTQFWLWMRADGEGNDGYIYLDNIRLIHEK